MWRSGVITALTPLLAYLLHAGLEKALIVVCMSLALKSDCWHDAVFRGRDANRLHLRGPGQRRGLANAPIVAWPLESHAAVPRPTAAACTLVVALRSAGLTDVVLSTAGVNGDIRQHFGDGGEWGVTIRYPERKSWGGSAGVIKGLLTNLGYNVARTVIVIYGDSLLKTDFGHLFDRHVASGANVSILAHSPNFDAFRYVDPNKPDDRPRTNYGVMNALPDGSVDLFVEKPYLDDIPLLFQSPVANAAVYAFDAELLQSLETKDAGPTDFGFDVLPGLLRQKDVTVRAIDIGEGYRLDIGTLPMFLTAQVAALRGRFPCTPDSLEVFPGVWLHPDAAVDRRRRWIHPAAIGPRARVASSAKLKCAIVCEEATIDEGATVESSVVMEGASIGRGARVIGSLISPGCRVGDRVNVPADSIVGAESVISSVPLLLADDVLDGLLGRRA